MEKSEKNELDKISEIGDTIEKINCFSQMLRNRINIIFSPYGISATEATELFTKINKILNENYKPPQTKTFDIDRIAIGSTTFQKSKIGDEIIVRTAISKLEGKMGKLIPIEELQRELKSKMSKEKIENALLKLKQTGDFFEPRKGYIQRV